MKHHNHISPKQRAFDKRMASAMRSERAERGHQQHKQLAETGKHNAKSGNRMANKIRSWRSNGDWTISLSRCKISPITWA